MVLLWFQWDELVGSDVHRRVGTLTGISTGSVRVKESKVVLQNQN